MRDRNNRSHKPKGRTDGGQYEHEHDTNIKDGDLTPPDMRYPEQTMMLATLRNGLDPWEQQELDRHVDDDTWLRDQYDLLTLRKDPDPDQALPILERLAEQTDIETDERTIPLGDHNIPLTIIDRVYGEDPVSLDRLLIRLNADDRLLTQLEKHADDPQWVQEHARPYRLQEIEDANPSAPSNTDPWAGDPEDHNGNDETPLPTARTGIRATETNPRIDTKPIWDRPVNEQAILDQITPLIHVGHTFTLTGLRRSGDRLHVNADDTDENNRHRTAVITSPTLARMIDDGIRLQKGTDNRWHITRTAGTRQPAATSSGEDTPKKPKPTATPTRPRPDVRTTTSPSMPSRHESPLRRGTLLKGILDLTLGVAKGSRSIIRDATRRIL